MVTLISEVSGGGQRRRRCDNRCYNATRPRCRCICGGHNHGVELYQAGQNTRKMAQEILEQAGARGAPMTLAPGLELVAV